MRPGVAPYFFGSASNHMAFITAKTDMKPKPRIQAKYHMIGPQ
jgi:hypothetical protein